MSSQSESAAGTAPLVSVSMITYNHEAFLAQAIEGVLAQERDFSLELVVGEDFSTDRTREILLRYAAQHPQLIRPILREQNVGAAANFVDTLRSCRGKYVAMLDGDDYWTSGDKLRRAISFLESNPDYALTFHRVTEVYEDGARPPKDIVPPRRRRTYTIEDLADWIEIRLSSIVFRNPGFEELPAWFDKCAFGDWALYVYAARQGAIRYFDESLGHHRIHAGGIYAHMRADRVKALKANVQVVRILREGVAPEHRGAFDRAIFRRSYDLVQEYMDSGRPRHARALLGRVWREAGYQPAVYAHEPLRSCLHVNAPGVFRVLRRMRHLRGD